MTATSSPSTVDHSTVSSLGGSKLFDVTVIGAGPAGLALSAELGERGLSVVCLDPDLEKRFVPNYGVWVDEVEPYGMRPCLNVEWKTATVFLGGEEKDNKVVLNRPYGRVDRRMAKDFFVQRCLKAGVRFEQCAVEGLDHGTSESLTRFQLVPAPAAAPGGAGPSSVRSRVVIDCTGHSKAFVKFEEGGRGPGYQAAYGIEADIEPGTYPFPIDEMLLMDYRDVHMSRSPEDAQESESVPTFIYCMPTNSSRVFFEETSLVAAPPVPFDDLKRRLYQRLELWGTKVLHVHEEEFCLIPMGGQMPVLPQRVIGFGGSAVLVHPATGYMLARTVAAATATADSVAAAMRAHPSDPDAVAAQVWGDMWTSRRRRQRDFFRFGGEYLESIGLTELRQFFGAFFKLPYKQWAGFLSFRLLEPMERLAFGLGVWGGTSNRVRLSLSLKGFLSGPAGWLQLGRSVLPVEPEDDRVYPTRDSRPDFFQ